ncbi:hypothetical protein KCV04_g14, partial [Aureobasidium melanogenum]
MTRKSETQNTQQNCESIGPLPVVGYLRCQMGVPNSRLLRRRLEINEDEGQEAVDSAQGHFDMWCALHEGEQPRLFASRHHEAKASCAGCIYRIKKSDVFGISSSLKTRHRRTFDAEVALPAEVGKISRSPYVSGTVTTRPRSLSSPLRSSSLPTSHEVLSEHLAALYNSRIKSYRLQFWFLSRLVNGKISKMLDSSLGQSRTALLHEECTTVTSLILPSSTSGGGVGASSGLTRSGGRDDQDLHRNL